MGPGLGGGTDVNWPKDETRSFNQMNRVASFDEMDVLHTYPFTPNQCVVFVKTFNSWHSVAPMHGPAGRCVALSPSISRPSHDSRLIGFDYH